MKKAHQKDIDAAQRNEEKIHDKSVVSLKQRFVDKLELEHSRI